MIMFRTLLNFSNCRINGGALIVSGEEPRSKYRWVILLISFITIVVVNGIFFSSGVLYAALIGDLGLSYQAASLPFSFSLVCYAFLSWYAGRIFDRYGPRLLFPIGAICFGLGLIGIAFARTPFAICVSWGLFVGLGYTIVGFVPNIAQIALWFGKGRGLATSVAISGISIGTLIGLPLIQYLVDQYGWRAAYGWLGVGSIVILVPLNGLGQKNHDYDLVISHEDSADDESVSGLSCSASSLDRSVTLTDALATYRFWLLVLFSGAIGWLTQFVGVHQVSYLNENGLANLLIVGVIGIASIFRAGGTMVWGTISDRLGREISFTIGSCFCICSMATVLIMSPKTASFLIYVYAIAFALGISVQATTQAASAGDIFGRRHLGSILGALELGWGLGGVSGTWFGGFWHDHFGSYSGAFVVTIMVCLLGNFALWLAGPRNYVSGRFVIVSEREAKPIAPS
jgi:MFS family permease